MSSRAYDYKLSLTGLAPFTVGNTVIGLSSNTVAEIVDASPLELKVKLANTYQSFIVGEAIISNTAIVQSYNAFINHSSNISSTTNVFAVPATYSLVELSDSITVYVDGLVAPRDTYVINSNNTIQFLPIETLNITTQNNLTVFSDVRTTKIFPDSNVSSLLVQVVTGNVEAASFISANFEGTILTANSVIADINDSPYISEKNAINQSPIVKLYSIYYPGEWYPPNNAGNPSGSGAGFPWPYGFPIRYAEVLGDEYYNQNPTVSYGGTPYRTQAMESDSIQVDSSGRIGEISLTISNFDGSISELVENKNILGFNSTRSTLALVNGELVQNIDPRTVSSNIFFNTSVQQSRGINAAWDYESTISQGDTWTPLRTDSRDLSGAVVDLVITYAKFLDYWPEHSSATSNLTITSYSWDISEALFQNMLVVNSAGTDIAYDVDFKPDGTKMYLVFGVDRFIREYVLTTPWDINSAISVQDFSIVSPDLIQRKIFFKPDGTLFYTAGGTTGTIYSYSLNNPWDISTASILNSFILSSQDPNPIDLFFKPDGSRMYVLGFFTDTVYEYSLSTSWDITTASLVQSKSVQTVENQPTTIYFKSDGTRMFIHGDNSKSINEFELSTAWDISTAILVQSRNFYTLETGFTRGMFFTDNGESLYIASWDSRASINKYSMVRSKIEVVSSDIYRIGDLIAADNTSNVATIYSIQDSTLEFYDNSLSTLTANSNLYIVNPDADSSAHVKHTFVLSNLEELDEIIAKFSLTSWLQYFKNILPKRKFYSTTCPFVYKGEDCKYPASGTGPIVGSNPTVQANGFFTFGNVSTTNIAEDICPKTLTACKLRKNLVNFGGFPNVQ
jgi:phage-related protein